MSDLQIVARPNIFKTTPYFVGGVPEGLTLSQIVDEVYCRGDLSSDIRQNAIVQLNGEIVPNELWHRIRPKIAAHVVVTVSLHNSGGGGGKKNPLGMVLSLAVIVAAAYAAPMLAGAMGFQTGTLGFTLAKALVGAVITGIGNMAINAMFPTSPAGLSNSPAAQSYQDSPTYSITGAQNSVNKFAPVPVVLGRHKVTPPLGAAPYTEISGNDEYLRMLFIWGYGPLKIENIKIGETPITDYEDVEIETREGRDTDNPITLIPSQVFQDSVGVTLTNALGYVSRTTRADADEISVDISFPRGLTQFSSDGNRTEYNVVVSVEYRLVGSSTWISPGAFNVSDKFVGNLRRGLRWKVPKGQYEVRLSRVSADTDNDRIIDDVTWSTLRTFRSSAPVLFPYPLAMTAVRIRASEQLQGVINDLNAIVTSYAPVWNGDEWDGEEATQNPAALMSLILTGPANARARNTSQIDDANLGAFYDFCDTNGYQFNMVRDYAASVWDVCVDVCSAARAAPTIVDGRWGVIMDTPDKPVVQHFTPRNSWEFSGDITYVDMPHAWRVKFVDEDNDFQQDERIVYDDGYSEANATKFEGIEFPGITNRDLIWKFGRYHIAQARLRPQIYTFNADFEHLVCQRGDLIRVSHDVPLWGSGSARVKSLILDEGDIVGVVLDDFFVMELGKSYVCRFRLQDGTSLLVPVTTDVGETNHLSFQSAQTGINEGDLAMFGILNQETAELLVKSIRPAQDMTAVIECVDYSPNLYEADQGEIPAFNPNISTPVDITKIPPAVPSIVFVESGTSALEKTSFGIKSRILVSLQAGIGTIRVSQFNVRYALTGSTDWRYIQQPAGQTVFALTDVVDGNKYTIQAQAVSIYGVSSDWSEAVQETVIGQKQPPANVSSFSVNIIDGTAYLSWAANTEIDLSHYRIKWSSLKTGATWNGSTDIIERVSATSISVPAQAGTYLIKAVDFSGNESPTAAIAVTTISSVDGLHSIQSIEQESPSWTGTADGVSYSPSLEGLVLNASGNLYDASDVYSITNIYQYGGLLGEGTFILSDVIDLLGVFKVRISASANVTTSNIAFNIYNIDNLYALDDVYFVKDGEASTQLLMSYTNDDPSASPIWSDFFPLVVGEYEGRAFRVAIKLVGKPPSITPVVSRVTLDVAMKERTVGFSLSVPNTGGHVVFSPEFFVTPAIGISYSNGQEGDKYTITNASKSGFDIAFTNGGSPVSRTISGIAKAYGEAA